MYLLWLRGIYIERACAKHDLHALSVSGVQHEEVRLLLIPAQQTN